MDLVTTPSALVTGTLLAYAGRAIRDNAGRVDHLRMGFALVGIYGSAARRDGDEDSDIDLVVASDDADASDQAADLAANVQRWTGNATHVVTGASKDLRRMRRSREAILAEWEHDLVVIIGSRDALRVAS